jgi:hypothetical protein
MVVEYTMWRLDADWQLKTELLRQPPLMAGREAPPRASARGAGPPAVVIAQPQAGKAPSGAPVAAERLFIPERLLYRVGRIGRGMDGSLGKDRCVVVIVVISDARRLADNASHQVAAR